MGTIDWIWMTLFVVLTSVTEIPEVDMNVVEIVSYYGYTAEVVNVKTEDGYYLQMHRIPYGKNEFLRRPNVKRPVVFFQHGLLSSSADWVTNTPSHSAAFLFADAGFDVWMGNMRGNVYSTLHENYSRTDKEYWQFSLDQMSKYDLDAMINKVLQITKQPDLYYVGHSQGTLTMFQKLSSDSQFGAKIRKVFALAPIGAVSHIKGLFRYLAEIFAKLPFLIKSLGDRDFLPNIWLIKLFGKYVCGEYYFSPLCKSVLFQIGGPENQFNQSRLPVFLAHTPAGTSTRNILHWVQMVQSGNTQAYNYGSEEENLKHYGQLTPPLYNLSKVNRPVYLYWSDKDWLSNEIDVKSSLIATIPPRFLKQNNHLKNYNHFDFIWGMRVANEVYKPIIQMIIKHEEHRGRYYT